MKTIQERLLDKRFKKFKTLYIYQTEIIEMRRQGLSLREIRKRFTKAHKNHIALGTLHGFIKNYLNSPKGEKDPFQ
jgi:hypothetical protein